MRLITWTLSVLCVLLSSVQVSAATPKNGLQTCKIVTGYGTAIAKAATLKEAREEARLKCGTELINDYFARRQDIPDSKKDDLALACINLECQ